jgi:hypothetical protein
MNTFLFFLRKFEESIYRTTFSHGFGWFVFFAKLIKRQKSSGTKIVIVMNYHFDKS